MKKWILGIGAFALAFAMLVTPTDSKVMAAGTTVTIEVMRIQGNEYVKVPLELTLGTKPAN